MANASDGGVTVKTEKPEECPYGGERSSQSMHAQSQNEDIRKFHVLDELNEDDQSSHYSSDSDVPDDEVERMLEEAFQRKKRKADDAGLGMDCYYDLSESFGHFLQGAQVVFSRWSSALRRKR